MRISLPTNPPICAFTFGGLSSIQEGVYFWEQIANGEAFEKFEDASFNWTWSKQTIFVGKSLFVFS